MTARRRAAEQRGRSAELIAALWLIGKGYRNLGHRLRTPFGEVDLAAWKDKTLIIVEVKSRRSMALGAQSISSRSQERIMRAAQTRAGRWGLNAAPIRLDLVVVGAGWFPKHERGAWFNDYLDR